MHQNADEYNIVAINMSLGGGEFDTSSSYGPYSAEIAALNNLGVCVVSASGNSYDENEIQGVSYPSSDKNSLSVGAVHSDKLYDSSGVEVISKDEIVYWSQRDDDLTTVMALDLGLYHQRISITLQWDEWNFNGCANGIRGYSFVPEAVQ